VTEYDGLARAPILIKEVDPVGDLHKGHVLLQSRFDEICTSKDNSYESMCLSTRSAQGASCEKVQWVLGLTEAGYG
jgi:hypothetical protein